MYRRKSWSLTVLNRGDGIHPAIDLTIRSKKVISQMLSNTMILFRT